eukprot:c53305_g1_i1.p1 GENE.c53305_g1_i1~~c53305_g1_i1.p1  ORF type:complete len:357 (+),score=61.32 c53305_g1_i1:32-1072(+)
MNSLFRTVKYSRVATNENETEPSSHALQDKLTKYGSLVTLVLQNTALVLMMRYSRTVEGDKYITSTAVATMEICKLGACVMIIFVQSGFSVSTTFETLLNETVFSPQQLALLAVPSFLYVVQNNLLYLALSNLDAVIFQVCYQLKILTTAVFSVLMLGRSLSRTKWGGLVLLTLGVALVQTSALKNEQKEATDQNALLGFAAVLATCVTSGFSGVFFEKILKGSTTTLWVRNVQMGITSVLLALLNVYTSDFAEVSAKGFFFGYNHIVFWVIFLQAFGGLTVAVVVKYADNILKGFAASYSIICSLVFELLLFDFQMTTQFVIGTVLVNFASYMYSRPDEPSRLLP